MTGIFSMLPQLAIALLILIGIALVVLYFYQQKKKKAPVTAASIPPLPTTAEADQHFATVQTEAVSSKKANRKTIIGLGAIVGVVVVSVLAILGSGLVNKKQTGVPKPRASVVPWEVCNVKIQPTEHINGGVYVLDSTLTNVNSYAVDVEVHLQSHYCSRADQNPCNDNGTETVQNVHLEPAQTLPLNSITTTNPTGACGSFQNDIWISVLPDKPGSCNNRSNPAYGYYTYSGNSCPGNVPTVTPGTSPTDTPPVVSPSVTPGTTPPVTACTQLSGLVMETNAVKSDTNACPPSDAVGKNGVLVQVFTEGTTSNPVASGTTSRQQAGSALTDGVFKINISTLPPGRYNVCVAPLAGYAAYCNINRVDGLNPLTATCAKVDTTQANSCLGNRLVIKPVSTTPVTTPGTTPGTTPPASTQQVDGQVFNVGTDRPNICSNNPAATTHYPGVNGVTVTLGSLSTVTKKDISNTNQAVLADGMFIFKNVAPGTYDLCMETRSDFYCANTSPTDTFNTQSCKKVTVVAGQDSTGHRFAIKQNLLVSNTPTPSTTTTPGASTTPVIVTATPLPTEIVLAKDTPVVVTGSVTKAAQPTIPSAGVPLPAVVIAVPAILVLLAFLL